MAKELVKNYSQLSTCFNTAKCLLEERCRGSSKMTEACRKTINVWPQFKAGNVEVLRRFQNLLLSVKFLAICETRMYSIQPILCVCFYQSIRQYARQMILNCTDN